MVRYNLVKTTNKLLNNDILSIDHIMNLTKEKSRKLRSNIKGVQGIVEYELNVSETIGFFAFRVYNSLKAKCRKGKTIASFVITVNDRITQ